MATEEENETQPIKVVIVGDGGIGKTCLLLSYLTRKFRTENYPTVIDNYVGCFNNGENDNHIRFWDTPGQEDYDRLRPLNYHDTNAFLVGFNVVNRASLANVSDKWLPEVRHYCGLEVPTVLVGMKTDLRESGENKNHVTTEEGMAFAKSNKMYTYVETSAFSGNGCDIAIKAAMEAGRNYESPLRKKSCCTIL